jgi:tetratricopeptide (TPR) repeat protein
MRRLLLLLLTGALAAVAAVGLVGINREPEWTTSSPAALMELEAALAAEDKLYYSEARNHLERALEYDPDFAVAKVFLANNPTLPSDKLRQQLIDETKRAERDRLSPRERFLIDWIQARADGRFDDVSQLVNQHLAAFPEDPYALRIQAENLWGADLEAAEQVYLRLLEITPNWVMAYNNLGYLAMSQGRFAKAEEYFSFYQFIVPDQANPHDSLGDLYLTVGRIDDAIACFDKAISIMPEFWESYRHLVLTYCLQGAFSKARAVIERARGSGACPPDELRTMICVADFMEPLMNRSWSTILDRAPSDCLTCDEAAMVTVIIHRAHCQSGRWRDANVYEVAVQRALERQIQPESIADDRFSSVLLHMQAVRLALMGRLDQAAQQLTAADEALTFGGSFTSMLKLWNRLILAEVRRAQGEDDEARNLLAEVRSINPLMAITYRKYLLGLKGWTAATDRWSIRQTSDPGLEGM